MSTANPSIAERLQALRSGLPAGVTLVAVSKTKPVEMLQAALDAGQLDLGENRVQELTMKAAHFQRNDIRWHHIGHLQTNKVKQVIHDAHLIHAVDSQKLLDEIEKRSAQVDLTSRVLLQLHIAEETQKHGFTEKTLEATLNALAQCPLENVQVMGLMGMATFTDDERQIAEEFRTLRQCFDRFNSGQWDTCSMGMSGDWKIAVEEGSTMIRVGSSIFGSR